jgi:hypothetical protein
MIAHLRQDRDKWREMAERLALRAPRSYGAVGPSGNFWKSVGGVETFLMRY